MSRPIHRSPRRSQSICATLCFFLFALPALGFDPSPRTGAPGQKLLITITTSPLPAHGATVTFFPPGLTASDIHNDAAGYLRFTLTIAPNARPGTYSSLYTRGGVSIPNPAAFIVALPTPAPPPGSPLPAPSPTPPGWVQVALPPDPVAPPVPPPPKKKTKAPSPGRQTPTARPPQATPTPATSRSCPGSA